MLFLKPNHFLTNAVLIDIIAAFDVKKCQRPLIQDSRVLHLYCYVGCLLKISKNLQKKRLESNLCEGGAVFSEAPCKIQPCMT